MNQAKAHHPVFEFERVLESVPARVFAFGRPASREEAMAIAYSGGLDSSVLLHLAQAYAAKKNRRLFAFHIHHGLNVKADDWLDHCRNTCEQLAVPFDFRRVTLNLAEGEGVEAVARRERYAALTAMCRQHGVNLLLTAHHEDDQVETVLMQLMRGAGVAGLSGMEILGAVPGEDDEQTPQLLRPLLAVSRQALEAWANEKGLAWVEDDSNLDVRYTRNAIRQQVAPMLSGFFPGFEKRVARSALHMQSASRLLNELAEMDWERCHDGDALDIIRMAELGHDRFDNLFRFWLDAHGLRMPSTAWLKEARTQLLEAREDAQVKLELEGAVIRRYRQHLVFQETNPERPVVLPEQRLTFTWQGESRLKMAEFGGELLFEPASEGVDAGWLREQTLVLGAYSGKAMLKVNARRPTKSLKAHYQERRVPSWERQRLPLLYAGERLLFAAGIGTAADCVSQGENRIWIGWIPA